MQKMQQVYPVAGDFSKGREAWFPAGATIDATPSCYEELSALAVFWSLDPIQIQSGPGYRGRLRAMHTSRMQFSWVHHGCGTRVLGQIPEGTLVLCFPVTPAGVVRFRGEQLDTGQVALQDPRQEIDFLFRSEIDIVSIAIDRELLTERAATLWQCDPDFSTRVLSRSPAGVDGQLSHVLERQLTASLTRPAALRDPVQGAGIENEVIDRVLAGVGEPRRPEQSLARRWIARRAAAFLEERFREDLDIAQICSAVRASRRTLHLGFLEVFDMPPMQYLRLLRLNAARREIRTTKDPRVSAVASRCGFSHFGRFSSTYHSHFGVLPSRESSYPSGTVVGTTSSTT